MRCFVCAVLAVIGGMGANAQQVAEDSVVKASSFGWKADDATECLQKAIDSGAPRIFVDRQAGDWIVRPILVKGCRNQKLVFEDGVTVRAKKGEFKGRNDSLFMLKNCSNFTMRGEGNVQLVMRKKDYQNSKLYVHSEWRHAIFISGGENIVIDNFSIRSSGGDAVELGYNPRNVLLANLNCRDHHRQGISVCSAIDLLVTNCVFSLTGGTPPQAGLDIEPFRVDDRVENVVFEDCTFDGNRSYGIDIHLCSLNRTSAPVSCVFRRCHCIDNRFAAIAIYGVATGKAMTVGSVRGTILFEDCDGFGNGGSGMLVYTNVMTNGPKTVMRNCTFDVSGAMDPLLIHSDIPANVAGLTFENVRLTGTDAVKPCFSPDSGAGAVECRGDLTFVNDEGRATVLDVEKWAAAQPQDPSLFTFDAGTVDFERIRPLKPGRTQDPIYCGTFAAKFTFVQATPETGEYKFRFNLGQWTGVPDAVGSFRLRDMLGTDLGEHKLKKGQNEFTFKSSANNALRFEFKTDNGALSLYSWARGCGVLAISPARSFDRAARFYFQVPANAEDVRVKQRFDIATGSLYNAKGEKVCERTKDQSRNMTFKAVREKTSGPEIWSYDFSGNRWEVMTRIGSPALPIVSPSKDAMIIGR